MKGIQFELNKHYRYCDTLHFVLIFAYFLHICEIVLAL